MSRTIAAGIDIGTSEVKVVIAEESSESGHLSTTTLGRGMVEARGLAEGYIVDAAEASHSVRLALDQAEKAAGVRVKRAFVSVGGVGLSGIVSQGSAVVSRADLEVTERDLALAQEAAEAAIPKADLRNRRIVNTIPVEYTLDGRPAWGRVEGTKATKVEVKVLFITCLEHHIEDLIQAVEANDIEVVDVSPAPLAASFVTVSKKQKRAGCCLACFGAETFSIIIFEDGTPVSFDIFPFGSEHITKDIALGLKVPLEEAEAVKRGVLARENVPKKKLDAIITNRLDQIFALVRTHLKKLGRDGLLPAGIIFTGGGAALQGLTTEAEKALGLPASIAPVRFGDEERTALKDGAWATAYGLCVLAFNQGDERAISGAAPLAKIREGGKKSLRTVSGWFSQFLP